MTTQGTLFDRRNQLRRQLDEADAATAARRSYAEAIMDADSAATAANLLPALAEAVTREEAAEAALDALAQRPEAPASKSGASEEAPPTSASGAAGRRRAGNSSARNTVALRPATRPTPPEGEDRPRPSDAVPSAAAPCSVTPPPAPTPAGESTGSEGEHRPRPTPAAAGAATPSGDTTPAAPTPEASSSASTTEYDGSPPAAYAGEDAGALGITGADVLRASCASALLNAKPGKPAAVTPVEIGGTLYVAVIDWSQWHWRTARLLPLVRREDVGDAARGGGREPEPYSGRAVKVARKGEFVVGAAARRVRWTDPNAPRPPVDWTPPAEPPPEPPGGEGVTPQTEAVSPGLLFAPETPTAQEGGL